MNDDIRKRTVRNATPEERERHAKVREQIAQELPELKQWDTPPLVEPALLARPVTAA